MDTVVIHTPAGASAVFVDATYEDFEDEVIERHSDKAVAADPGLVDDEGNHRRLVNSGILVRRGDEELARFGHGEWTQASKITTEDLAQPAVPVVEMNNDESRVYKLDGTAPPGTVVDWRVSRDDILDLSDAGNGACRVAALGPTGDCTLTVTVPTSTDGSSPPKVWAVTFRVTGPSALVEVRKP